MQSKVSHYFDEFLPILRGRQLLKNLKGISACFEVLINDVSNGSWNLVVDRGRLVRIGHDGPEPATRFELDSTTLFRITGGEETPHDAFFDARIEIEGDIETGLALGAIFALFFEAYPYVP